MTGTFLTRDQLTDLTGYKRPADQVHWLREHGIPHGTRADGQPVLTLRVFEEALLQDAAPAPRLDLAARAISDTDFLKIRHQFVVDPYTLQRRLPGEVTETCPGVYFIFHAGVLMYVGKAQNVGQRIYAHTLTPLININPALDHRVAFVGVPKSHICAVESYYLVKFQPPMNKSIPRCVDPAMSGLE